jgi:hypothetical protein
MYNLTALIRPTLTGTGCPGANPATFELTTRYNVGVVGSRLRSFFITKEII